MHRDALFDLAALKPGEYGTAHRHQEWEGRVVMVEYALVLPDVLARLVTCARALRVLENIAGPIPFVRHTAREALVGIIDTAQEPPHD